MRSAFSQSPKAGDCKLCIVLFGPTASGKTGILQELINDKGFPSFEVISADSMQVYRGMDIGTAKPPLQLREKLPHHLIDILEPDRQFNAGDFVRLAEAACCDITGRGKIPVISGGTGFYLKNFIMGLSEAPPSNKEIRDQLNIELKQKGAGALRAELFNIDPVSAERIHINDEYRLLRALEVWRTAGRPLSSFNAPVLESASCENRAVSPNSRSLTIIGLECPREDLYRRINERCDLMFRQGLIDEVQTLFKKGYTPDAPGLRAIGYHEFFYKDENGTWNLLTDIDGIKTQIAMNTRRYAKRQITYFKGIPNVNWIELNGMELHEIKRIISEQ